MLRSLLVLSLLSVGSVYSQDMSRNESIKDSYRQQRDGTSRYVGKCLTHEDYEKVHFKVSKTILETITPADMTLNEISMVLGRFQSVLISEVLNTLDVFDMAERGSSRAAIFKDFIDDMTVEKISLAGRKDLNLIRFNVGVGGGNGGYLVFDEVNRNGKKSYKLLSFTFDGDLNFCDSTVWVP